MPFRIHWPLLMVALGLIGMALPHRYILGRLFGFPYAFFALAAAWYLLPRLRAAGRDWVRSPLLLAWSATLAGIGASILLNDPPAGLGFQIVRNVGLPVAFLLLGLAAGRESALSVLLLIAASGFGNVAVGLYTALRAPPVTDFSLMQVSELYAAGRIYLSPLSGEPENATGLNSASLGALTALLAAFVERRFWLRLGCIAVALGLVWLGFLTETRGILAVTAVAAAAAVAWLLVKGGRLRTLFAAGVVGAGIFGILSVIELPERFRLDYWLARGSTGRMELWHERLLNIPDLLFGVGPTQSLMLGYTCHNQYLELFATFGLVPGTLGLLAAALSVAAALGVLCRRRSQPADGMIALGALAVLGHAFIESHIFSSPQAFYLLLMLNGALAAAHGRLRTAPLPARPAPGPRPCLHRPVPLSFRPAAP